MYAKCANCGYSEEVNKYFILNVLGKTAGAILAGGGFWAWVSFFFAGTGLALPICIALVAGGIAVAAFSSEIAEWLSTRYTCPSCGAKKWDIVSSK